MHAEIFFFIILNILKNKFWLTGAYTPRSQSGFPKLLLTITSLAGRMAWPRRLGGQRSLVTLFYWHPYPVIRHRNSRLTVDGNALIEFIHTREFKMHPLQQKV
jgi:hypothetical protein